MFFLYYIKFQIRLYFCHQSQIIPSFVNGSNFLIWKLSSPQRTALVNITILLFLIKEVLLNYYFSSVDEEISVEIFELLKQCFKTNEFVILYWFWVIALILKILYYNCKQQLYVMNNDNRRLIWNSIIFQQPFV